MATAHLSVKVGKSGKGVPHAEYISRVGKYEKKLDGNEQLEATESGNMPLWAQDNPYCFGAQPTYTSARMAQFTASMKSHCQEN